jgi:hypothetical protein
VPTDNGVPMIVRRCTIERMRKRLGKEPTVPLTIKIPGEWMRALVELSDSKNTPRDLARSAIQTFIARHYTPKEEK